MANRSSVNMQSSNGDLGNTGELRVCSKSECSNIPTLYKRIKAGAEGLGLLNKGQASLGASVCERVRARGQLSRASAWPLLSHR